MLKKLIWTVLLLGLLFYGLTQLIFRLSLMLDSARNKDDTVDEEVGLIFPPVLDPLPEATNSAELRVSGTAQNAHSVELMINGIVKDKIDIATTDETFLFDNLRLYDGENVITAVSYNGGQKSNPSDAVSVYYKKGTPKLIVEYPEDGAVISAGQKEIEIRGITDPENTVTVNGRIARTLPDGSFRLKYQISSGDTAIEILSRDRAGNETKIIRTVHSAE